MQSAAIPLGHSSGCARTTMATASTVFAEGCSRRPRKSLACAGRCLWCRVFGGGVHSTHGHGFVEDVAVELTEYGVRCKRRFEIGHGSGSSAPGNLGNFPCRANRVAWHSKSFRCRRVHRKIQVQHHARATMCCDVDSTQRNPHANH